MSIEMPFDGPLFDIIVGIGVAVMIVIAIWIFAICIYYLISSIKSLIKK
jgi:uncharacterized membrane protein